MLYIRSKCLGMVLVKSCLWGVGYGWIWELVIGVGVEGEDYVNVGEERGYLVECFLGL